MGYYKSSKDLKSPLDKTVNQTDFDIGAKNCVTSTLSRLNKPDTSNFSSDIFNESTHDMFLSDSEDVIPLDGKLCMKLRNKFFNEMFNFSE